MGKTTFSKIFKNQASLQKVNYLSISADSYAENIITNYKKVNPSETDNAKIFEKVWLEIITSFHEGIFEMIASDKIIPGQNFLMIDDAKIDPKILKKLTDPTLLKGYDLELLAIYPASSPWVINNDVIFPFSFQFITNLCFRALTRGSHETFNYPNFKKIELIFSFCFLYKNIKSFEASFGADADYSRLISVQFQKDVDGQLSPEVNELEILIKEAFLNMERPFQHTVVTGLTQFKALADFFEDNCKLKGIEGILNYGSIPEMERVIQKILIN